MVQGKRQVVSFKIKKMRTVPPENWIVVENTHTPLIEKSLWERVQIRLSNPNKKIRRTKRDMQIDLANIDRLADNFEIDSHDEIGIISSTLSKMSETISDQLNEINKLSEEKRASDIQALRFQINPHFLYNTLNVIESLADIHSNTKISSITKSIIELLQYSVNDSSSLVNIECEIDYIKNYLKIFRTKTNNRQRNYSSAA